jgi:hypothetical protein
MPINIAGGSNAGREKDVKPLSRCHKLCHPVQNVGRPVDRESSGSAETGSADQPQQPDRTLVISRRAVLRGASSAGVVLSTPSWADEGPLRAKSGNIEVRSASGWRTLLRPSAFGDNGRLSLQPLMTSWLITATNIKFANWRPAFLNLFVYQGLSSSLRIHAEMDGFPWRFEEVAFADWIAGKVELRTTLSDATTILSSALARGAKAEGEIDLAFDPNVEWHATPHDGSHLFLEERQTDASGIRFRLVEPSASPFARYVSGPVAQAQAVLAEGRTISGTQPIPLGESDEAQVLALPQGPLRISSERRASGQELGLIEGAAAIQVKSSSGTDGPLKARTIRRVFSRLNNATTITTTALIDSGSVIIGGVPLVVQSESQLRGDDTVPDVNVQSQNSRLKRFEGRFQAHQVCLAVPGADFSRLNCRSTVLRFVVKGVEGGGPFAAETAVATFGAAPEIAFPLDASRLHVKRSDEMLDLKFTFRGISLVVKRDGAYLISRIKPGKEKPDDAAIMVVEFPPQHVAERAYFVQGNGGSEATCSTPSVALTFPDRSDDWFENFQTAFEKLALEKGITVKYDGPPSLRSIPEKAKDLRELAGKALEAVDQTGAERFEEITEARLSGCSRLAFRFPDVGSHGEDFTIEYNLYGLTDWRRLELSVVRRAENFVPSSYAKPADALELTTDTSRRLSYIGLRTKNLARTSASRLDDVRATLAPPDDFQTSIELPFRLFLSPERRAHFLTPRPKMRRFGEAVPLWTTELDWSHPIERRGIGEVRAIWSTDFRPAVFTKQPPGSRSGKFQAPPRGSTAPWLIGEEDQKADLRGKEEQFRTGLDAYDRHELVVLSSVHGLPVLPRPSADRRMTGDQLGPPPEFALEDLAAAGEEPSALNQALYDPQPLGVRELALSSLGGNLDLDATFEPPFPAKQELFPALTVERWRQRTVLGRDVLVEVVYKGFLFPIGHRCSLVKLTERTFEPNPLGGHPTAYLTQRMFLRINKPSKDYPAIGQPFEGRAWPPRSVTLVTRRTPDLVDPNEGFDPDDRTSETPGFALTRTGRLQRAGTEKEFPGLIFWPRTAACAGAEVLFEMRIDGAAESIRTPLLFIDNAAAVISDVIADVVRYYNGLESNPVKQTASTVVARRVRWDQGGAMRRYASETQSGEASLLSQEWVVGAEGRARQGNAIAIPGPWSPDPLADQNNDHVITAVMNAADQPPFYPRLRAATVRVQSFERLAGRQVQPSTARYLPRYLRYGYEPTRNETFLSLLSEDENSIRLDFSGGGVPPAGDRGGGVGQPNLTVNAMSRKRGPTLLSPAQLDQAIGGTRLRIRFASADARYAQSDAPDGTTVSQTVSALLGGAKILGLNLTDLVSAADLADEANHPELKETLEYGAAAVQGAADSIRAKLRDLVEDFEDAISSKGKQVDIRALISLYPDLEESKSKLLTVLNDNTKSAVDAIAASAELARRFVAALGRAAADPLAPVREGARDAFRGLIAGLILPEDTGQQALLQALKSAKDRLSGVVRDLLKSPDLMVWRRIVLALPSARVDVAPDVNTAIEKIWVDAVDAAFAPPGRPVAASFAESTTAFRDKVLAELQARIDGATAEAKIEIIRLRDSVERKANEALLERFAAALSEVEHAIGLLGDMLRDPGHLLEEISIAGGAILDLAATQAPALLSREAADICIQATDALAFVTASALPDENALKVLGNSRAALNAASGALAQAVTAFEQALELQPGPGPWPADVRQMLLAWTSQQRAAASALVGGLDRALAGLTRSAASIKPADLIASACRTPDAAPFAIMHELDDARRALVIELSKAHSAINASVNSNSLDLPSLDFVKLKEAIDEGLRRSMAAPTEAARNTLLTSFDTAAATLRPSVDAAAKTLADLTVRALDASTVLGAVATADSAQSIAVDKVRVILRSIRGNLIASTGLETDIDAAIAFFDPIALRRERDELAASAQSVAASQAAALAGAAVALKSKLDQTVAAHLKALDGALQTGRTLLLAGSEAMTKAAISSVAPVLIKILEAIEGVDRQVIAARAEAIARLSSAAPKEGDVGAKNLAGLAALLKILPASAANASHLLACPFFVTAQPGAACPDGVEAQPAAMRDAVAAELETVGGLKAHLSQQLDATTIRQLQQLASDWQAQGPAASRLLRQLLGLAQDVLRGDLGRFIDLAGFKAKIEEEIRGLLPLKSKLEHRVAFDIHPPGFLEKIFIPDKEKEGKNFEIITTSTIDLSGAPGKNIEVTTSGTLTPFKVKLLGDTLDVATLNFSAAKFESVNGSRPSFTIRFLSFEPGKAIEFVQPLQQFLSPGETGPRIEPLRGSPGVAAGYGINLGIISIGTVSFANVILNAVAELPFDETDAKFKVGLGRRDAPFLISALPYTGGGYFAVTATGGKIDGFEASFEFGGGGAFSFGPLNGQGRLTTGIFIKQSGAGAYMDGFFYCGGSARIAFFGVSASLTVRLGMVGGDMAGEAVFEFAFSLGIKDFTFHVTVWRRQPKGFGQKTTSLQLIPTTDHAQLDISPATGRVPKTILAMRPPIRFAALGATATDGAVDKACRPIPSAFFEAGEEPQGPYTCIMTTAMCQSQDWATYESYFDLSILDRMPAR